VQNKNVAKIMADIPKSVSEPLKSFEETKSLAAAEKAIQEADAIDAKAGDDDASRKRLRSAKLSSWLAILNDIDRFKDARFNPNDVPAATVAPPVVAGVALDSGMDPKGIKNAEARRAYEEAIAANQRKAEQYKVQTRLRALDERVVSRIDGYVKSEYKVTGPEASREDQREVAEAVTTLISDATRRAQLVKLITSH
jgi:hypothetical protein